MFGKKKNKEADQTEAVEYSDEEMDQLMDDSDSPGLEPQEGSKTRSKNGRVALISFIALVLIAGIYFGSKYYNLILEQKDKVLVMVGLKKEVPKISIAEKKAEEEEKARLAAIARLNREAEEEKTEPEGKAGEGEKTGGENVAQEVTPGLKGSTEGASSGQTSEVGSKEKEEAVPVKQESAAGSETVSSQGPGQKPVRAESPRTAPAGEYAVQIGSFAVRHNAVRLIKKFTEKGYSTYGVHFSGASGHRAVFAGPFYSKPEAEDAAREMRGGGIKGTRVFYNEKTAAYRVFTSASARRSRKLTEKIQRMGFQAGREMQKNAGGLTAVYIGNFASAEEAEKARQGLSKEEIPSSLIVKRPKRG